MILERCYDPALVESFMTDPVMWATAAEDNVSPESFKADVNSEVWLAIYTKQNELAGFYYLHPFSSVGIIAHANIHPDHRKTLSKRAGAAVMTYILHEFEDVQKVITYVPEIYPNVIKYVESCGMIREGVNRKSYRKNGQIVDLICYGITRNELRGKLCQPH